MVKGAVSSRQDSPKPRSRIFIKKIFGSCYDIGFAVNIEPGLT